MVITCCELVRKGRYVAAEPWFDGGDLISLPRGMRHAEDVGKLVAVAHPDRGGPRLGRVIEVLGHSWDTRAALRGLLAEWGAFGHGQHEGSGVDELPVDVEADLARLPESLPFAETREDVRSLLCVTIDPPDAKDHDDAIGVIDPEEGDPDGTEHVLWVHIADVSAYVRPGTALDTWALTRAMSAYAPGVVAPMLPRVLSSDLCSLRPGVDRGCVSVRMALSADGEVLSTRFARTLVRSARRLAYGDAQKLFEDDVRIDPEIDRLLFRLDSVTKALRGARMRRGALDLALPETTFGIEHGVPVRASLEHEPDAHRLVEECMLLANGAVGLRLAQANVPEALFRVHPEPDPAAVTAMVGKLSALGVPTPPLPDVFSSKEAAKIAAKTVQMATAYAQQKGTGRFTYPPLVLRALGQATYIAGSGVHSGLATADYAHFTSPIRRYPDLVNHRALLRLIGADDAAPCIDDASSVGARVSERERELMKLEYRSDDIVLAGLLGRVCGVWSGPKVLHEQLPAEPAMPEDGKWPGEIVGLIGGGAFVRFGDVYEGFIPVRTISHTDRYELDEDGNELVSLRSGAAIKLGDSVEVRVTRIQPSSGKVTLALWQEGDEEKSIGDDDSYRHGGGKGRDGRGLSQGGGSAGKRGRTGGTPKRGGGGRRAGRGRR